MTPISWSGDNSTFVVEQLLPRLTLDDDVRQVIRWAYGYDGTGESYERRSDGRSVVRDNLVLGRLMKDPPGVGHDWIFWLHRQRAVDPSGHDWTLLEANDWYKRAVCQFGQPIAGVRDRLGLFLGSWPIWCWG